MSLTSYRAAPPRGNLCSGDIQRPKGLKRKDLDLLHPPGRPGDDLLSRVLRRSTIGSGGLNDRVRNGIGWGPPDKTTRSTGRMLRRYHLEKSQTTTISSPHMGFYE